MRDGDGDKNDDDEADDGIILIFTTCVNLSKALKHEKESKGSPKSSGYDFSKYANGADIPPWSPTSRRSFTSSWSSADGDDPGLLSSSEESGDEQAFEQTNSFHDNLLTGASVWCLDCWGDFLVVGCSDGTIEVG